MNRWYFVLPLLAAGCTCGAFDPTTTRFVCSTDTDCGIGFRCVQVAGALECVAQAGGSLGGGGGGTTGGGGGGTATGGGMGGGITGGGMGGGITGGGMGGGITGGGTGGGGGGGGGGGTPADRLAITTPPQTLSVNTCSHALTVQTQNSSGQPTAVPTSLPLTFTTPGGPVITFHQDSLCSTPAPNLTVGGGITSTTVFFRITQSGSLTLTANAGMLQPATQVEQAIAPPDGLAFAVPLVIPLGGILAGSCIATTLEAQLGGAAAILVADAPVSLQSVVAGGLRFYSDASCTNSATSITILAGQSRQSFSFKTITGGMSGISATASFGAANVAFPVQGVVRKGTCMMGFSTQTINCNVLPAQLAMGKTMVIFQATSASSTPSDSEVRCRLAQNDVIICDRLNGNSPAIINWQTAELPTGLTVHRRFASPCPFPPTLIPLVPGVDPSSSFVLSSFLSQGTNFDENHMSAARLVADAGVEIDNRGPFGCSGYEFQVVELSGVSVNRGTGSLAAGQRQTTVSGLSAASLNTVVLNQQLASGIPASTSVCNVLVRSELGSTTSVLFRRGSTNGLPSACTTVPIAELPFERVDFGARARVQTFTLNLMSTSTDVPIQQVDSTRTLVFASGQVVGGQGSGESGFDNLNDDSISTGQVRLELVTNSSVRVTRARSQSTVTITFFVVELEP